MKIESYAVTARSERTYERVDYSSTTLYTGRVAAETPEQTGSAPATLDLSDQAKQLVEAYSSGKQGASASGVEKSSGTSVNLPASAQELKLQLLDQLFYALTGKKISSRIYDQFEKLRSGQREIERLSALQRQIPAQAANMTANMNVQFTTQRMSCEKEAVSYQAQGLIQTADGRAISVNINLNMSREVYSYVSSSMSFSFNPVDPLVINYGGTAASLTDEKFDFDLNFDGVMDRVSFAASGSGFLALDKNGDGVINNGSELFGPNTGSGFGELQAYDLDGNGWIDENDDVFDRLIVWSKDANGNDQYFKLKDLGIGAIYLGDVETQFSINGVSNDPLGAMRSTSFFLKESGGAGTISHVDLTL